MSRYVKGALGLVRAAGSGLELDVRPANLAGTEKTSSAGCTCGLLPQDCPPTLPRMYGAGGTLVRQLCMLGSPALSCQSSRGASAGQQRGCLAGAQHSQWLLSHGCSMWGQRPTQLLKPPCRCIELKR